MRGEIVGIISEGAEDQGVLKTILKAFGFESNEIRLIRPSLSTDTTDRYSDLQSIGTLQGVKNSCIGINGKRPDFEKAFADVNCKNIVIQIDTAEIDRQDFPFVKPKKENNPNYCNELREKSIKTINHWLEGNYKDQLFYAIAIEEIEAWCLTIYEKEDTTRFDNLKRRFQKHLERNNLTYKKLKLDPTRNKREYFESVLAKNKFHKHLKQFAEFNQSLKDFVISLEQKFNKQV